MAKECFEQWILESVAVELCHLHSDHEINIKLFVEDCKNKFQTQSFSGDGSHHQNALSEESIQNIMNMAQTFLVHVCLHWSKYGTDHLALWGFAMKHTVWLHSHIPNHFSGLTHMEPCTKIKDNYCDLLCTHVWGCPVHVLDPKLQYGQKIPQWNY